MRGRIKRKQALQMGAFPRQLANQHTLCVLCERPVPSSQVDAHHLVPKSKGGTQTVIMHRMCHRQVHALLTETELERHYCTVEQLRAHEALARFVQWVKDKPDDFMERTRKSRRLRPGR
ncbi:MAG TPA: HNH endonuclease signature motif containing protein [Orrella sp.]